MAQLQKAYSFPTAYDGEGQTIAIVEFDNYLDSDISYYAKVNSLPTPNVTRVYLNPTCEVCFSSSGSTLYASPCNCYFTPPYTPSFGNGWDECTMDIQLVFGVAPKTEILVYISANIGSYDVFYQIAQDNRAKVVTTSWGALETSVGTVYMSAENIIFKQMATQGQTVLSSSGDSGGASAAVQDPSSQPYVTGVGKLILIFLFVLHIREMINILMRRRDNTVSGCERKLSFRKNMVLFIFNRIWRKYRGYFILLDHSKLSTTCRSNKYE